MRALGPIGWDGRGVASSPDLLVAEAQFPRPKSMGKTTYQTSIPRVKNFRRSWGTHSARAVLECPRVSFAADEIRLIRPINVLNIVATVATDDHLARLHGGFILPPSSLCISFPSIRYLLQLSVSVSRAFTTRWIRRPYPYNFLSLFFLFCESKCRHEESTKRACFHEFGREEGEKKISVN